MNQKISFQQRIDNLDESSINDLIDEIKSNHCNDKEALRIILYLIRKAAFARPNNIFLYLRIIENIADSIKRFFTSEELALIFRFISNKLIFLKLYNLGAIGFESVFNMIKSFHTSLEPLIYFYPEIKKNSYDIYLKARPIINKEVSLSLSKDQEGFQTQKTELANYDFNNILNKKDTSQKDNHAQHFICDDPLIEQEFIKYRETGQSKDSIAEAIRNDDVERFQSILFKTNTPVNDCPKYSIFEQCNIVNKGRNRKTLRFIEYAAFVGSLKIFRFLLNKAELTEKISKNAVKGGNYEIIHLCEYHKINFPPKCLTLAIRFHHNEIVDYLIDNYSFHFDIATTISSIQYYNWDVMCRCIPIFLNPDPNISNDNFSALATASINGYLDVVKILCSLKNIDINYASGDWNAVMYATFKGYVYLLKFFTSHFKTVDDLNDEENDNSNKTDNFCYTNDDDDFDEEDEEEEYQKTNDNSNTDNDNDIDNNEKTKDNNNNDNDNLDNDENADKDENINNEKNNNSTTVPDNNEQKFKHITNIIDLNQRWDGRSPLEIAVLNRKLNVIEYLLQFKSVLEEAKKNKDLLIKISHNNEYAEIEEFLKNKLEK